MKKIATYYARCSTDKEEQKQSIENQISGLMKYAEDHDYILSESGVFSSRDGGNIPYKGYVDEGFSGAKSTKYRKAFLQMMKDAKTGFFDVILTKSVSRFGRNVKEMLIHIDELKKIGVGVWFEDIQSFSLNNADMLKIQLFATLAEAESTSKSDSIQWAKKEAAKKGIWSGREPYGYNIVQGKLAINDYEAEVVRRIYELYIDDLYGVNKIAKKLYVDDQIPTKRGGKWTGSHVAKILKNEIYLGKVRQHRTRKSDINSNLIEKIPIDKQIIYDDQLLRIIDDETFFRARAEMASRPHIENFTYNTKHDDGKKVRTGAETNGRGRYSTSHLFSNLLCCGNCGGMMRKKVQKTTRQTHNYYYCRNHEQYGNSVCEYRNLVREEEMLEWIKEEIKERINAPEVNDWYYTKLIENRYQTVDFAKTIKEHNERLTELAEEKETNFRLVVKKFISDEEYNTRNQSIDSEMQKLQNEIKRLNFIDDEIYSLKLKFEDFNKELNNLDLNDLSNVVLRKFLQRITITTYEGETFREINWRLLDSDEDDIINNNPTIKQEIYEEEMLYEEEIAFMEQYGE
ncbi:recombinase family protein [Paenibacillus polymyxa]|uniref:recombinase family protein n=1 Tax=Paenibacillus polymyxa TaxID=1406 RepID=UPI0025B6F760|nr:recombinase family protein [Paenibacillus polymyxa]MDN4084849.1 recombinase family protein [Paenibacillus polymyxa]MDN4108371.1 recombinase family protein [Paenibacillus polymyxa]